MDLTLVHEVLLIILILLQIAVMIYLLYINHKRHKNDEAFYKQLCENLKNQQAVFLNDVEGGVQCEQPEETGDKE